jgi:arginase
LTTIAVPYFMGDRLDDLAVPHPYTTLRTSLPDGDPQSRMAVLYEALATEVAGTADPVVYAGDCVSIIGVLAGLYRRGVEPTIVFFDAHGDFNTWETTPSGFIGGMPLAMITGRGSRPSCPVRG